MFTDDIVSVCFYNAEPILSVIAKFLVYLLGEGRNWMEWGRVRESVEGSGRV